jgi:hypothetical protein
MMAAASVEAPRLAPEQEQTAPLADAPKLEAPKIEVHKPEAARPETAKPGTARPEAARFPGKLLIMSPGEQPWHHEDAGSSRAAEAATTASGNRRFAAMAAVAVLATLAGAIGGALATAGLGYAGLGYYAAGNSAAAAPATNSLPDAAVARIDADLLALKAGLEHTARMATSQFNKTSDRLDRLEKAQAEPAARIARLNDTVEKLKAMTPPAAAAAPVAAAQPVAPRDITGTVTPPVTTTAAAATPQILPAKPDIGRLPTVEGWVLRDVLNGSALIENRRGVYEVYTGDPVPGLGRVDAIRKQDGRWVVVTSKGLIVAR